MNLLPFFEWLKGTAGSVAIRESTLLYPIIETSHVLTFFANGGPGGLPPFSLLDNVVVSDVPEPSTWAMLIAGFGLVGVAARRRRTAALAA